MSREQRRRALRDALRRAQSIGPFQLPPTVGLASGFAASFAADAVLFDVVGTPLRQLVNIAAFTLVAAPVWLAVQRDDVRRAIETLTWLNGWEQERWEREIGRRLPGLPRATPEILDVLPDTLALRPLRVELLAAGGASEEAWRRLDALPTDTGWQRFERAALEEYLLWWTGGPTQLTAMSTAVTEVDDDERRLVARAMVAAAEARRAAVNGGDVVGPLAAVRPDLGDRPRRYAFGYRTGVVIGVVLVGVVASLAVLATSAVIR